MKLNLVSVSRNEFIDILENAKFYETADGFVEHIPDALLIQRFINRNFDLSISTSEACFFWNTAIDAEYLGLEHSWKKLKDNVNHEFFVCNKFIWFLNTYSKQQ